MRFGFVRFLNVADPIYLEKKLDQIYVGEKKLYVNIPRFSRDQQVRKEYAKQSEQQIQGKRDYLYSKTRGNATYAQALLQGNKRTTTWQRRKGGEHGENSTKHKVEEIWKGRILKVDESHNGWLEKCLVGRLHDIRELPMLQEKFVLEGFSNVNIRYMGDNMVFSLQRRFGLTFFPNIWGQQRSGSGQNRISSRLCSFCLE